MSTLNVRIVSENVYIKGGWCDRYCHRKWWWLVWEVSHTCLSVWWTWGQWPCLLLGMRYVDTPRIKVTWSECSANSFRAFFEQCIPVGVVIGVNQRTEYPVQSRTRTCISSIIVRVSMRKWQLVYLLGLYILAKYKVISKWVCVATVHTPDEL